MINKWVVVFALVGVPLASAKSYNVTIASPCIVHSVRLNPGDYKLTLDGSKATFKDENGNSYEAAVNVQQASTKSDDTEVLTRRIAGQDRLEEIRLHGSTMKLEFN